MKKSKISLSSKIFKIISTPIPLGSPIESSKEKFIEFSSSEKWKTIEHHRTEGLESQWLLAAKENSIA